MDKLKDIDLRKVRKHLNKENKIQYGYGVELLRGFLLSEYDTKIVDRIDRVIIKEESKTREVLTQEIT